MSSATPGPLSGPLAELAREMGVDWRFVDGMGIEREAEPEIVVAILRALGAELGDSDAEAELRRRRAAREGRWLEPVLVSWDEAPPVVAFGGAATPSSTVELRIEAEDGGNANWRTEIEPRQGRTEVTLPSLPFGYYRLELDHGSERESALVISAPSRVFGAERRPRSWGAFLPLHALRTERDHGAGDLGDLARLVDIVAERGGSFVGVLPLLAQNLQHPFDPSPYAPMSRLFWSELWAATGEETEGSPPGPLEVATAVVGERIGRPARGAPPPVDYRAVAHGQRQRLGELARQRLADPGGETAVALEQYRRLDPEVERFAAFRAVLDARGESWRQWPERLRRGELAPTDYRDEDFRYHLFCQWLVEGQLRAIARRREGCGLYLDLPVGVHGDSYDLWRFRESFAEEMRVGAPPDPLFTGGQNWGFPPLVPERQRRSGYRYFRAVLRTLMRHAALVRLDHVMALDRLYWLPDGAPATAGAYVRYPADELYAMVCLESHRAHTRVVGEDLGTVPAETRERLERHAVHRMFVLEFELGGADERPPEEGAKEGAASEPEPEAALPRPRERVLACLDTHDTPPFAAFLRGLDLDTWRRLGQMGEPEVHDARDERRRLLERLLRAVGGTAEREGAELDDDRLRRVVVGCLHALARGPAELLLINLEDLWLETEPQNVPGTGDEEGNWRRRARLTLEQMRTDPEVVEALDRVDSLRRESEEPR